MSRLRKSLVQSVGCCVGILLLCSPSVSEAQEQSYPPCNRQPSETDLTAAKGAFQAGNAAFDEADYPRAITYWEDAYRRDCTAHALLLNLARAYELNGKKAEAIVALQVYLERVPNTPDKDKITRRIDVLRGPPPAPPPAPPPPPPVEDSTTTTLPPPPPPPALEPVEPLRSPKRSIAPLIVAAAGGVALVGGGVWYFISQRDLSDARKKCPGNVCDPPSATRDANDARERSNISGAIAVGGAAVAGVGLAWYFLSSPSQSAELGVKPAIAPGYAGLLYGRSF